MFAIKSRRSLTVLVALAAVSAVAIGSSSAPALPTAGLRLGQEKFVGSWRLVSFEARTSDGQVQYPFGHDAQGVLTYTGDGRMSATLWKAQRPPFAIGDQQRGTADEYTAAVQSYVAYLGTFDVDREAGTVSHHLEQSIFPNWNGTTQTRFYKFSEHGDRLELTTPPTRFGGVDVVAAVVWDRIGS